MDKISQLKDLDNKLSLYLQQEKLKKANTEDRVLLVQTVGEELKNLITPVLEALDSNTQSTSAENKAVVASIESLVSKMVEVANKNEGSNKELLDAIQAIQVKVPEIKIPEVKVTVPEIKVPEARVTVEQKEIKMPVIKVPKPEVTVNVPAFPKIPKLEWPEDKMPIEGWVQLMGVNVDNPLPVQLRDSKGMPVDFNLGTKGFGGGKADFLTIKGFVQSAFSQLQDGDGNLKVAGSFAAIDVQQVSGAIDSVNVITTVGLTDAQLRASHLDVQQVSGSIDSVNVMNSVTVLGITNSTAATILNGDGVARDTWGAKQDGTWNISTVTGITNSLAASFIDSSGIQYSGSNPVPVAWVSGAGASTTVSIGDSTGVAYEGSNPLPVSSLTRPFAEIYRIKSTDSTVAYHALAEVGSAQTAAVWRIRQIFTDTNGEVFITWEDGNSNFDNQFDTREAGSYS